MHKYADYQDMIIAGEYSDEGKSDKSVEGGKYYEDIDITNKDVLLGGTVSGADEVNQAILCGKVTVNNAKPRIYDIVFRLSGQTKKEIVTMCASDMKFKDCYFEGDGQITGIYSHARAKLGLQGCVFKNLGSAVIQEVGEGVMDVQECFFSYCNIGVVATDTTYISDSKFTHMKDSCIAAVVSRKEQIYIENCELIDSHLGIKMVDAAVKMVNCLLYHNYINVAFENAGIFNAYKTTIKAAKGPAFAAQRNLEKNKYLKEYAAFIELEDCLIEGNCTEYRQKDVEIYRKELNVTRRNNDEISSYVEGAKKFIKKWF